MSCDTGSSFQYSESMSGGLDYTYTISTIGSYTLPSYSTPSTDVCVPTWYPGYVCDCSWSLSCNSCGWRGWGTCCNWNQVGCGWCSGSTGWCCCSTIPGVEVWPSLTFTASTDIPLVLTSTIEYEFSTVAPVDPTLIYSMLINACNCSVGVTGDGISETITINLVPLPTSIDYDASTGEFSATTDLGGFSSTSEIDGITYTLAITSDILFCAEPVPPVGWVNIVLNCTLSAYAYDVVNYTVEFSIVCPIVSVEEEG